MAGRGSTWEHHPDGWWGCLCRRCKEEPAVLFEMFHDSGMGGPIIGDRYCRACAEAVIAEGEAALIT